MTRRRNDGHSTEFGLWLRDQGELDSSRGFIASNLDYIWHNYKTGQWMFIEEKRFMSSMKDWQKNLFRTVHMAAKSDPLYKGFAFLQFEKTCPQDGKTFWNYKEVSEAHLIEALSAKVGGNDS